jgi:hypothetical protein
MGHTAKAMSIYGQCSYSLAMIEVLDLRDISRRSVSRTLLGLSHARATI